MGRYNASLDFPDKSDYLRLKALAITLDKSIGETLKELVDEEMVRLGITVQSWEDEDTPSI